MEHGSAPAEVLRRVFGFSEFRGQQAAAVEQVVSGGDALVLMPTGGGKSLCYQVPALCREGTAIVISPLIALMDDQVASLRQLGVCAAAMHSEVEPDRAAEAARDGFSGKLCIHPAQIAPANAAFTPSPERVEWARRVAAAFAETPDAGVLTLDGAMIDQPHLKLARRVLASVAL